MFSPFSLTPEQAHTLQAWMEAQEKLSPSDGPLGNRLGAIGGRWTYCFTATGLGMVIRVQDNLLKQELDLTPYEEW